MAPVLLNPSRFSSGITSAYGLEVLADSPLAYYRIGEPSGTTMTDSSGNSRNGTYTNVTLGASSLLANDSNTAGTFSSAYGDVADAAWMDVTDFTIEGWVNPSTVTGNHAIISRDGNSGSRGWNLYQIGAALRIDNGAAGNVQANSIFTIGATKHVAMTYTASGTTVRLYVNGSQVQTGTFTLTGTLANNFAIGGSRAGAGNNPAFNPFAGVIDEVAYYGTALSAARLSAHYAAA